MINLTKEVLKQMLIESDKLLVKALNDNDTQRMYELIQYKAMVKDMLIEALEHELELTTTYKKAA